MKKRLAVGMILLIVCLAGCTRAEDFRDISGQRVLSVRVSCDLGGSPWSREYAGPEAVTEILHCLRCLRPDAKGGAEEPVLSVELLCADGSGKCYRLCREKAEILLAEIWNLPDG